MTTLPQTTSVRLPRPPGAPQLPGQVGGVPAVNAGPAVGGMTGQDIWRIIRGNIWLLLGFMVAAPIIGYALNSYLSLRYPAYTATGLIEINTLPRLDRKFMDETAQMDSTQLGIEQKTQVALLKNEALLTRILAKPDSEIRKTQWYKGYGSPQDAKLEFYDNFTVTPINETKLIKIEWQGSVPKDCKAIVQEMVDSHIEEQRELSANNLSNKGVQLHNEQIKLEMRKRDISLQIHDLALSLNLEGGGIGKVGIKDLQLSELVRTQTELQLNRQRAYAQLQTILEQLQQGIDPPVVENLVNQNTELHALKQQLDQVDVQLLQIGRRQGPQRTQATELQEIRVMLQKKYDDGSAEARAKARNQIVEELRSSLAAADKDLQSIEDQVKVLKQELGELTNKMSQYLLLQDEEKGLRERLKVVEEQLENIGTIQTSVAPIRVDWRSKPDIPNVKTFPKLWVVMSLTIASCLALALGIAFLRELSDTSVRSPRDIARIGQMSLLGMVCDEGDDPQAAGARLPLVIFDAPHSMTAEQLRAVRTRLQHAASLDTTRSIMVSSPGPGDGKTTIATNLAAGLALNGRRILLVDANFRRPEVHRIFAIANEQGFSDVLAGTSAFEDMVQETQVPNLSVMTSGPKPINATEMFESQLLIDFIERALEEYDHVVFDSGPLMVVAEAGAMAPRVDGVVTVVRAKGNSRGLLARMRDLLRQVKAEHLGVVLNAVRAQGGGYYGRTIKTYYEYQNG